MATEQQPQEQKKGRFEPKVPVNLNPAKDDPISVDYLSKCNGTSLRTCGWHASLEKLFRVRRAFSLCYEEEYKTEAVLITTHGSRWTPNANPSRTASPCREFH